MRRAELERRLRELWYGDSTAYRALLPLAWVYGALVGLRRAAYRIGLARSHPLACQVIVVGNLVVGGGGKTPLVIALAHALRATRLRIGILCSGYRARARHWPQRVYADSDPRRVGDEAVLLAQATGLPVMAGPDRVAAGRQLLRESACELLLCDDGLQHYRLRRDLEIVVLDGEYPRGNGACLPAGPLREPWSRLRHADAVVALGRRCAQADTVMEYRLTEAVNLLDPGHRLPLSAFVGQRVHAVAGIARPERFFSQLRAAGLELNCRAFDDHHDYVAADLRFPTPDPVLMTAKDAVKCRDFPLPHAWVVPVEARLDPHFTDWLTTTIKQEH